MSDAALKVQKYLQYESDYWSVKESNGRINCYFMGNLRFSITEDDGEWFISGIDISLEMAYNIAISLGITS